MRQRFLLALPSTRKAPLAGGAKSSRPLTAEGVLPQEGNSGRAESFRGIRPYGVRLKGKAPAS